MAKLTPLTTQMEHIGPGLKTRIIQMREYLLSQATTQDLCWWISADLPAPHQEKAYGLNIRAVVNPKESGVDNVVSDNDKICLTCRNGYIYVTGTHSEGLITVYDLSGRIVFSDSVMEGTCRLPELAGGIYLVSYTCNGNTMTTQK